MLFDIKLFFTQSIYAVGLWIYELGGIAGTRRCQISAKAHLVPHALCLGVHVLVYQVRSVDNESHAVFVKEQEKHAVMSPVDIHPRLERGNRKRFHPIEMRAPAVQQDDIVQRRLQGRELAEDEIDVSGVSVLGSVSPCV